MFYLSLIHLVFLFIKTTEIPMAALKRIIKLAEKKSRININGLLIVYAFIIEYTPKIKNIHENIMEIRLLLLSSKNCIYLPIFTKTDLTKLMEFIE